MENQIFKNVILGKNVTIYPPCIIGFPPRGKADGELETRIGDGAVIRPFTTIYAGTTIGRDFQTGQGASIREGNIIGDDVSVGTHAVLEFGNRIGNSVRIHTACFLEGVKVGNHVFLGPHVVFTDDPHPMKCPHYLECAGGATVDRGQLYDFTCDSYWEARTGWLRDRCFKKCTGTCGGCRQSRERNRND